MPELWTLDGIAPLMKPWPEEMKQVLRHLAAARYFLPVTLKQPDGFDTEAQYEEFLHHTEFGLAMEYLEDLGQLNTGYAEEGLFWSEMLAAAQLMGSTKDAERYRARVEAHNAV